MYVYVLCEKDNFPHDDDECEEAPGKIKVGQAMCDVMISNQLNQHVVTYKVQYEKIGIYRRLFVAAKGDILDPANPPVDVLNLNQPVPLDIALYYKATYTKNCNRSFSKHGTMDGHFVQKSKSISSGFKPLTSYNAEGRVVFTSICNSGGSAAGPTVHIFHF